MNQTVRITYLGESNIDVIYWINLRKVDFHLVLYLFLQANKDLLIVVCYHLALQQ